MSVSAIIPTYQRPKLIVDTVSSLLSQTSKPTEILIGDDSLDDSTEIVIRRISASYPSGFIQYFRHSPPLKEAKNVDALYRKAQSEFILHLHDDDPVFSRCIEILTSALVCNRQAVASFGLQRVIDERGEYMNEPEIINRQHFRTEERSGLVNGLHAAAIQMFPNSGFMVRADVARSIGYDDNGQAGHAADFYFGLRLGKLGMPFFFVNDFTSMVRMTPNSQSRNNLMTNSASRSLQILAREFPSFSDVPLLPAAVRQKIPIAISEAATLGEVKQGWKWYFSEYHRDQILSAGGARRAAKLLLAALGIKGGRTQA
jgi:glycosyltransferase involved in cell wall biosynthesis